MPEQSVKFYNLGIEERRAEVLHTRGPDPVQNRLIHAELLPAIPPRPPQDAPQHVPAADVRRRCPVGQRERQRDLE